MTKIVVKAWSNGRGADEPLPPDARFVCGYEVDLGLVSFDEAAFLRRAEDSDELWVAERKDLAGTRSMSSGAHARGLGLAELQGGCRAVSAPMALDEWTACVGLLRHLFRARVGFGWPTRFLQPGLLTEAAYRALVDGLEAELDRNSEEASKGDSEIVRIARELGLYPGPTGTGRDRWKASCPETNHPLYIDAAKNVFGCGWCRRKGGPDELRAFVETRRKGRW